MTDIVTGASVDVEVELPIAAARLWELITDVPRISEWSPECVHAAWLDEPGVGARFEGRNVFPHGFVGEVVCEVTAFDAPTRFAWTVFDDDERPASLWSYELTPRKNGVLVRQRFEHGPGVTGLKEYIHSCPEQAEQILADRLEELRRNMSSTLAAMAASVLSTT